MATPKKTKTGWEIVVYVGKLPDGKRIYKHLTGKSKAEVLVPLLGKKPSSAV